MLATVGILAGGRTAEKTSTQRTAVYTQETLEASGYSAEVIALDTVAAQLGRSLVRTLREVETVLPLISGLEGFLAALDVAYVGSSPLAAGLGAHKGLFNDLLQQRGLKLVDYWYGPAADADEVVQERGLSLPLFVKPCRLGASNGVTRVDAWLDFPAAVNRAAAHDQQVLIEKAVCAPVREFGVCAVVDPDGISWSEPCEVMLPAESAWHDNDSKYSGGTDFEVVGDPVLNATLRRLAAEAIRIAEFGGAVRVDLFVDSSGAAGIGEINCVPGYGPYADTPRIFEESGVPRAELFTRLIASAQAWQHARSAIHYSM